MIKYNFQKICFTACYQVWQQVNNAARINCNEILCIVFAFAFAFAFVFVFVFANVFVFVFANVFVFVSVAAT